MKRGAAALLLLAWAGATAFAAERHSVLKGGERFEIVDRGGLAIWQGDIVIGRTAELLEATRQADLLGAEAIAGAKSTGLGASGGRWPRGASGLFEVPYVVESDPEGRVPAAIEEFNREAAGMFRAVPRTAEADYVAFTFDADDKTGPCFSSIGRVGGRQIIGGASNCVVGRLVHEIGHALGLFHEQERADYARWITIDLAAVDPELAHNYVPAVNTRDLGPYDFGSIMHYGPSGFTKFGANTMETIPPGIPIGQRDGYSRGDINGLQRLYGMFDSTIVVDTFPSGLAVIVDGASRVAPASFNWTLGSTHTLEVAANAQTLDGVVHRFARWSSDTAGTLATRQTITVSPGAGTLTEPAAYPAVSVYTANFVRMKEVRITTSGNRTGVGGTVTADIQPAPVAGVSGNYYRERQPFTLTPSAAGGATFGRWSGTYSFSTATSTRHSPQMRGPLAFAATAAAYEFQAYFVDYPFVTVRARSQDGEFFGISATVARASGSTSQRLPYQTVETVSSGTAWTPGETATLTVPTSAVPFAASVRYRLVTFGSGTSATASIMQPSAGQSGSTVFATYNKQYEPYRQVLPSCAGTLTAGTQADGWVDAGASMPVTIAPASGWMLARWRGSLSGTGNSRTLAVSDVPDLIADLNIVPSPLVVSEVRPAEAVAGRAFTLEILGSGFSPASRVFVANVSKTPSSIEEGRIVVPLAASDFPANGRAVVTVQNRPGGTGNCALNASGVFEVFAAQAAAPVPAFDYTDLWWNAAESGWGLNLIQHPSNAIFGVMYTYDGNGKPMWLVLPAGAWTSPTVYTGALYRVTGPPFTSPTFNPAAVNVRQVGSATLTFSGRDGGTFAFGVDGTQVTKPITRQPF